MSAHPKHVVLRRSAVLLDWKLSQPATENNGRKHVVTELWERTERPVADAEWAAGQPGEKTPVLVTGQGGIEIATFTEQAGQDRHVHRIATEIYMVLAGTLKMLIEDEGPLELTAGDEVIVLPGTVHEILRWSSSALLVRVHAFPCFGDGDKYVQLDASGPWHCWKDLLKEDRKRAYRKSG